MSDYFRRDGNKAGYEDQRPNGQRVDRVWMKFDGRLFSYGRRGSLVGVSLRQPHTHYIPRMTTFWVAISTARDPQGPGGVDILKQPYTTAACAAGWSSNGDHL